MTEAGDLARSVDVSVPNVARIYDYILGGKDISKWFRDSRTAA
jgi:hypothetical protein